MSEQLTRTFAVLVLKAKASPIVDLAYHIFSGGRNAFDWDHILEYFPDTVEWKQVGTMREAKRSHAVSVVKFQDFSKWCI